jgi:hypothetical protein
MPKCSVSDPDWIRIQSGQWIRITCKFFPIFGDQPDRDPDWLRIGIQPKMLDPDPYRMNTVKRPKFDILFGENIFFHQNLFG